MEQGGQVVGEDRTVQTDIRRSTEDTVTQDGGVLRARSADVIAPRPKHWNPFQELEAGERGPRRTHPSVQEIDLEAIPDGMEGHYFH